VVPISAAHNAARTTPSTRAMMKPSLCRLTRRFMIKPPTTPSSVLPVALITATIWLCPKMLAPSAPMKIAGHMRRPNRRIIATARPAAGQTGETPSSRLKNCMPSLASA
jgi:hypothetical protein